MARIRSIKPEFFTSPDMARLSVLERLTYIGLWTHVDDEGRCLYEPRLIHAALFALDDEVSLKKLHATLMRLEKCGQITSYEVHDRRYLQIVAWHHQRISHPTPSKYPPKPTQGAGHDVSDSGEVPEDSDMPPETLRPDQGTGNREQGTSSLKLVGSGSLPAIPPPPKAAVIDRDFVRWWDQYPRKVGKKDALKSYRRARRDVDADRLIAALEPLRVQVRTGTELRFIPHPATWLNAGRWEDEAPPPMNGSVVVDGALMSEYAIRNMS